MKIVTTSFVGPHKGKRRIIDDGVWRDPTPEENAAIDAAPKFDPSGGLPEAPAGMFTADNLIDSVDPKERAMIEARRSKEAR